MNRTNLVFCSWPGIADPRDLKVADLLWDEAQTLFQQSEKAFESSGLSRSCRHLKDLCIYEVGSEEYCVDLSRSDQESTGVYVVTVKTDVSGYRYGFDRQERYWRTLRVYLEALAHVADVLEVAPETAANLRRELDSIPMAPPWPAIPEVGPCEQSVPTVSESRDADLSDEPGVLWITTADSEDEGAQHVFDQLTAFVQEKRLGEWNGDSRGGGEADISFEVSNLRDARIQILAFVKRRWPELSFTVGDQPRDVLGFDM